MTTPDPSSAPRPPGPRGLPLLGLAPKMRPDRGLDTLQDLRREYGDVFRIPMPGKDMIVVSHPDAIERVLVKRRDVYVKAAAYDGVRELVGDSMLTLEGNDHTVRRRIAQPAFHMRSLTKLAEIMTEATARWFDRLKERLPDGGSIEIHREMTHITLEIVVECLFGRGLFERTTISYEQLSAALELLSNTANGVPVPRWLPTPGNLRFKRVIEALDTDVQVLIDGARAAVARGEDDGSLLQMLLRSTDEETGAALSDEALRDEVVTLFIAGHETTALTMTWFFALVTGEQPVIDRLRDEVAAARAEGPLGFKALMGMEYTRRVIDEVMRLRPPAPWVGRDVVKEDVLGGFRVAPGDLVLPSFWLVHRHPDFWTDPDRFDPDRFAPEASKGRPKCAFVPFSTGPRICIGNLFSYVEATVIIAELVERCTWTQSNDTRPQPEAIATVRPSAPLWIDVSWR